MIRTLLTALAVQAGWAACVVGATSGRVWLRPAVVAAVLSVRVASEPHKARFIQTLMGALFVGVTLDGLLVAAGVLVFPDATTSVWPVPIWMMALWGNFVLALDALHWLASRPALASAVGAVGGPLSYLAGARLGAVTLGPTEAGALVAIALEWAVALPLLLFLASNQRAERYRRPTRRKKESHHDDVGDASRGLAHRRTSTGRSVAARTFLEGSPIADRPGVMMAYLWVGTCLLTMAAALTWGFSVGDFWEEGAQLMRLPWGVVSVVDVYTGAALFCGWIAFRERSRATVVAWVLAIIVLGNLATSAYALLALTTSRGDLVQFWMGRSRTSA